MLSARLSQPTIFAPGTSSLSICATRASTPSSALRLRFIWLRLRFRGARRGTRAGSVSSSQQALWRAWGFSKEKAATSGLFFHRSVRQAWEHVFRSARKWAARACGERRCPSPVRACLEVVDFVPHVSTRRGFADRPGPTAESRRRGVSPRGDDPLPRCDRGGQRSPFGERLGQCVLHLSAPTSPTFRHEDCVSPLLMRVQAPSGPDRRIRHKAPRNESRSSPDRGTPFQAVAFCGKCDARETGAIASA
jgi:hypothetical protein